MHISSMLDSAFETWPDKDAVVCGEKRFTYSELHSRVLRLANGFSSASLNHGDRIAIIHHNCHIYLEAYFASAYTGLVITPINTRLASNELSFILQDSGAKLLIANFDSQTKISDALSQVQDLNLENIIWTGVENEDLPKIQDFKAIEYENSIESSNEIPIPRSNGDDETAHLYYTSGTTGKPKGVILTH